MGTFVGLDYSALEMILRAHQIPETEWYFVLDKLNSLHTVLRKYWEPPKPESKPKS